MTTTQIIPAHGRSGMLKLISSQTYRDETIVQDKRAARDYVVSIVTLEGFGLGPDLAVVVDGHHSLTAAALDGVAPVLRECMDVDVLAGIDDIDGWLTRHAIDSDYRFVSYSGHTDGALVF